MHSLVVLARQAIESYVKEGKVLEIPHTKSKEMEGSSGVFVSLKKDGQLRGCIGTFSSTTSSIAAEIIQNAISAATKDPRFPPVSETELHDIDYSVDVLSTTEKIKDISELDHKKYGVIVSKGYKRGLLLPDLEGVNCVEEQLKIAKYKANIAPDDDEVEIYRFSVRRYR